MGAWTLIVKNFERQMIVVIKEKRVMKLRSALCHVRSLLASAVMNPGDRNYGIKLIDIALKEDADYGRED